MTCPPPTRRARVRLPAPLVGLLVALGALLGPVVATAGATGLVVGGRSVGIEDAPWAVAVDTADAACSGSILDATHVVTAAHCTYAAEARPLAASALTVAAGTSTALPYDADAQVRRVVAVRRHPRYVDDASGRTTADDVAVLELDHPLALDGTRARALPLAGPADAPTGAVGRIAGFGVQQEGATTTDGRLHAVDATLVDDSACADDPGVQSCAAAADGAPCAGDSGAGVVVTGRLAAVVSGGERCAPGSPTDLGDLTAGELAAFVLGSDAPPEAPRGPAAGTGSLRGVAAVGSTLLCEPGTWTGGPAFRFTFFDAATGAVLQDGPVSARALPGSDLGRSVVCRVTATSAGGTASAQTRGTAPVVAPRPLLVASAPVPAVTAPARLTLAVGSSPVRRGRRAGVRVVLRAGSAPLGRTRVCLRASAGSLLRRAGLTRDARGRTGCATVAGLSARRTRAVVVRLRAPRRGAAIRLRATATPAGAATLRATARVALRR